MWAALYVLIVLVGNYNAENKRFQSYYRASVDYILIFWYDFCQGHQGVFLLMIGVS